MRHTQSTSNRRVASPRRWMRMPLLFGAVGALVLGLGAGAAYGYFTSSGQGSGTGIGGTMASVTLATAGSPSAPLLPGGPAGDLVFSVTNPNNFNVSLVDVALQPGGTVSTDSSHSGCATTDSNPIVSLTSLAGDLPVSIAKNSTVQLDLANAVSMDATATNGCQGATISVPVTITVHSS
jgi:hypothetical protein